MQSEGLILSPKVAVQLPLDRHPAAVYLARLASENSRRTQRQSLEAIAQYFGQGVLELAWHELRYQHSTAIRSRLIERYKPATANRILSALRGVLREAWRLQLMPVEEFQRAIDVPNIQAQTLPAGRALSKAEIHELMNSCIQDNSNAGYRDAAMLCVLRSGLRRSEVVALDLSDLDGDGGLLVRGGKGRKDRQCYLSSAALPHLQRWLTARGSSPGALFFGIHRSGTIQPRRLSAQAVLVILQRRAAAANLPALSPHDWRRTFVSDLLDAGVDIATVQKLAGHASPTTTARYDRRGEAAKPKAADLLVF